MDTIQKTKRRGCPKGGWPSQRAKKAKEALAEEMAGAKAPFSTLTLVADEPLQYAFSIKHTPSGGISNLWSVEMVTLSGNMVTKREYLSSGDTKANSLARLRHLVYQLYFLERMPAPAEMMPSQPAFHG